MSDLLEREEAEHLPETTPLSRRTWLRRELREMGKSSWEACKLFLVLLLICGVLFPLTIYGLGQILFPFQANGSLITNQHHQVVGSRLIGQSFTSPNYFHGRPSAAGYDASNSSGSNLGPTNQALLTGNWSQVTLRPGDPIPANAKPITGQSHTYLIPRTYAGVKTYAEAFRQENHLSSTAILPADIVTASGSGLDPDISVEAALLQVNRIMQTRHLLGSRNATLTTEELHALISNHTSGPDWGFLGETRVNVLELNLDLDIRYGAPPAHA
jgi:K+-transporting ATPase ATPase C chain